MEFAISCDIEEFRGYWSSNGYTRGDLDHLEQHVFLADLSNLIVWREKDKIVGHAVWHESTTEEHRKGDPRDDGDRTMLERLLKGKQRFVELHEIWLMRAYRGKGYGQKFFSFFEELMRRKGYDSIVYYADHPAAIAICRQRGYQEAYVAELDEYVFYQSLKG